MPIIKPTRGIQLNKTHPLARGLVFLPLMNEGCGKKVYDLSGNGNIGANTGATWTFGKFGSSLYFNEDYIRADSVWNQFPTNNTAFTIVVWVKPDSVATQMEYIDVGNGSSTVGTLPFKTGFRILAVGDDLYGQTMDGDRHSVIAANVLAANVWQQVAFVYDGNANMELYRNGSSVATAGSGAWNKHTEVWFGSEASEDVPSFLLGKMDIPMIWNRALSASEIALLYREPFCMFERAWKPRLTGGQIVELVGTSAVLSSLSAAAKATRKIGGTVAGTSDVSAGLNSIRSLAASIRGLASVNGSLDIGIVAESSLEVERSWIREALFNGVTSNAFKLGTSLSLGWFWVRVAGCSVLYSGAGMQKIDFANILVVAEQDACEISPPNYISHYGSANGTSTCFYVVRRFNNCGYQEYTLAAAVRVSIESNGELAQPQPNKVFDSAAEHTDGNKICFVWFYCPIEQKSQPVCFNIYYDARTRQIDYENPLATIGYKGRKFYSFKSSALEAGKYLFAIRAEDAGDIENSSLARLRIQLDTSSPEAVDILRAEAV